MSGENRKYRRKYIWVFDYTEGQVYRAEYPKCYVPIEDLLFNTFGRNSIEWIVTDGFELKSIKFDVTPMQSKEQIKFDVVPNSIIPSEEQISFSELTDEGVAELYGEFHK